MLAAQRKDLVLTTVRCEGRVVAKDLAELALSEDATRRDLRDLAVEGLPHRVHGGAPTVEVVAGIGAPGWGVAELRAAGVDVRVAS